MAQSSNERKKRLLQAKSGRVPDSGFAQNTAASVPIVGIHEKYQFIETYKGCYVKSYLLGDNNYQTAPEEDQLIIYKGWKKLLNSFGSNMEAAVTINNHSINMQEFCEKALHKEAGDGFDELRKDWNDITLQRINEGKNGIQRDKYLTVAVHAPNALNAARVYHRLDQDIDKTLSRIGSSAAPVPLVEQLDLLYGIYNDAKEHLVQKSKVMNEDGSM